MRWLKQIDFLDAMVTYFFVMVAFGLGSAVLFPKNMPVLLRHAVTLLSTSFFLVLMVGLVVIVVKKRAERRADLDAEEEPISLIWAAGAVAFCLMAAVQTFSSMHYDHSDDVPWALWRAEQVLAFLFGTVTIAGGANETLRQWRKKRRDKLDEERQGYIEERLRAEKRQRLPCPACGTRLAQNDVFEEEVQSCSACRGIWFEGDSLEAHLERLEALPASDEPAPVPKKPPKGLRKCPWCSEKMKKKVYAGSPTMQVHVCEEHGTFVREREFEILCARHRGMKTDDPAS